MTPLFDPRCQRCPRLADHLAAVRQAYPDYHAAPVAAFGDAAARLLVVGLAPGMHGANATGRPFTGDYAGILLYATLHRFGFADRPVSIGCHDGLMLQDCRITNAVKCLPPETKPTTSEVRRCNGYLAAELERVAAGAVILALGRVAHGAVLRALGLPQTGRLFAHGAEYALPGGRVLLESYQCSRYNTQTRRLTEAMFHGVCARARALLQEPAPSPLPA